MALALVFVGFCLTRPATAHGQTQPPVRCDWSDQSYDNFYVPPPLGNVTPDRLGEVLRVEHISSYTSAQVAAIAGLPSSDYGAEVYRILYISQAPEGSPVAVSGRIAVPVGQPVEGGYPIIDFGHGTTGTADTCAPSRLNRDTADLLFWVANGFEVTATDYPGLGTPGPHPYLVGDAEGYSMLDAARAALRFCDDAYDVTPPAEDRIFFQGHSQGGQAALFAHEFWSSYAPELNVLGTVALAPGSEGRFITQQMAQKTISLITGSALLGMNAQRAYYGAPADLAPWVQEPYASEVAQRAEEDCVADINLWTGVRPNAVYQPNFLTAIQEDRWQDIQPWTQYIDESTPGNFSSSTPILIAQGQADGLVLPEASERLVQRLCTQETPVKIVRYDGVTHFGVVNAARADELEWVRARLQGMAVESSCGRQGDPVIVIGRQVAEFLGLPVNQLAMYSYRSGAWLQIPAQIDDVNPAGQYTDLEDGIFDYNDEVVFMSQDLGERAPGEPQIGSGWYELRVTDPVSPTQEGWIYLVNSGGSAPVQTTSYVSFDPVAHQLHGQTYTIGLPTPSPWLDFLSLGSSGVDILDRTKVRLDCAIPILCPITEESLPPVEDGLVKNGPIRVILRNGALIAYGSNIVLSQSVSIPALPNVQLRISADFSRNATGSTMYNAAVPQGVVIDGTPDATPAVPLSPWWQISSDNGTVVQVSDLSGVGGQQSNFYLDDRNSRQQRHR